MKVLFNGMVLAESDQTVVVEGYHYFPPEAVHREFFQDSPLHTICPRKGEASYFHVTVNGKTIRDAAWYYAQPNQGYQQIQNHVAFYSDKITFE